MKFLLLSIFLVLASKQGRSQALVNNDLKFHQTIKRHLETMDSLQKANPDSMEQEEFKFEEFLSNNRRYIFDGNALNEEWLFIAKSSDGKFCLVSWDTQMGGTMIDFATMAIFKKRNNSLVSKMLVDTSLKESEMGNAPMHYDTVYVLSTPQKKFYLAEGFGQGSTAGPWQEVRAFEINNDELIYPNVFPKQESSIMVEFDTHQFADLEKIPVIEVKEKGKKIVVPVATEDEGFSGKYKTLILKGESYKEQ